MMNETAELLTKHRGKIAVLIVAGLVLVSPIGPTVLGGGDGEFMIAANAPAGGDSMAISLRAEPGLFGGCGGKASVEVSKDDVPVFSSIFGQVPMSGCSGTFEIPYSRFVSENGLYTVRARYDGMETDTTVLVEKVVNWVYLRSFTDKENERVRVEFALDRVKGQPISSSVFTSGTLEIDVRWETCTPSDLPTVEEILGGEECEADSDIVFHDIFEIQSKAVTFVYIPWDALESPKFDSNEPEDGWYNVSATFHNDEAAANRNVPMDPTLYREDPPAPWFEVDYE